MYSAKIKSLYEEYGELIEFCRSNGQVSFELYINDTYKKALLRFRLTTHLKRFLPSTKRHAILLT